MNNLKVLTEGRIGEQCDEGIGLQENGQFSFYILLLIRTLEKTENRM